MKVLGWTEKSDEDWRDGKWPNGDLWGPRCRRPMQPSKWVLASQANLVVAESHKIREGWASRSVTKFRAVRSTPAQTIPFHSSRTFRTSALLSHAALKRANSAHVPSSAQVQDNISIYMIPSRLGLWPWGSSIAMPSIPLLAHSECQPTRHMSAGDTEVIDR